MRIKAKHMASARLGISEAKVNLTFIKLNHTSIQMCSKFGMYDKIAQFENYLLDLYFQQETFDGYGDDIRSRAFHNYLDKYDS